MYAVVRRAVRVRQKGRRDVRGEAKQLRYERAPSRRETKQSLPAYVVLGDEVLPGVGRHGRADLCDHTATARPHAIEIQYDTVPYDPTVLTYITVQAYSL